MKQVEFFQNALANSVEILLNTEAQVRSHLTWLIESKRQAIENMAKGNVFNSDELCNFDKWDQQGIEHNVDMKVVAVTSVYSDYDIISSLKRRGKNWIEYLFEIKVVFMRDPAPVLSSKAKLTTEEKSILKWMNEYYREKIYEPDGDRIMELNRRLTGLKHKYNMAFTYEWKYDFNDIIDKDFLVYGLRANGLIITDRQEQDDDEEE